MIFQQLKEGEGWNSQYTLAFAITCSSSKAASLQAYSNFHKSMERCTRVMNDSSRRFNFKYEEQHENNDSLPF